MAYTIFPEYEFFTGVEIKLSVDGEAKKTFVISKLGEHLQSLSIKEGTMGNGQQLVVPDVDGGIASGTVSLYDEDNALFLSLIASKTPTGQQLLNRLDITLKTYTGIKVYNNCRINKWSCDFNGGVPTIRLEWQSIGGTSAPAFADTDKPSFDPEKAKSLLMDEGVDSFGVFMGHVKDIFNNNLSFKYTTKKVVDQSSLREISSEGDMKFFNGENIVDGKINIPDIYLTEACDKKYRFKLQIVGDSTSFLTSIMKEICSIAKVEGGGESQNIQWKLLNGDTIFIYSYKNMGDIAIPEDDDTKRVLDGSVFVYNTSFPQGGMYRTPQGMKRAFIIDSIGANFDFSQVLVANLSDQNNSSCPNGNMIITSRGAVMVPQSVPADVAKTIKNIENLNLSQNFNVRITVYNFVHFYVMGETLVDLIVFDHLGNIHPITGKMRIVGYQYDIGQGGVIKADVTLAPPFSQTNPNFEGSADIPEVTYSTTSPSVYSSSSISSSDISIDPSQSVTYSQGKADIKVDASLVSNPSPTNEEPNFLGIQVKKIPGANFAQGTRNFKKPPRWIVVHYSASWGDNAQKETIAMALKPLGKKDVNSEGKAVHPVSTHFFCDHKQVYQVVEENFVAYHCGNGFLKQPYYNSSTKKYDGKKYSNTEMYNESTTNSSIFSFNGSKSKLWRWDIPSHNHIVWGECKTYGNTSVNPFYGIGDFIGDNSNSFGVDLCSNKKGTDKNDNGKDIRDVDAIDWYIKPETIENCAKVVAYLCYKYDIPVGRVIRHCDCTGKPCLPLYKTEIYTPEGFIPLSKIRKGDIVYQYNKNSGLLEQTSVISVVSPYVATVCRNREYETTLNHRTFYKDSNGCTSTDYLSEVLHRLDKDKIYLYTSQDCKSFYPNYILSMESHFYNDVVSCIEVDSGYIVIRQNKTVFITGNCPRPMVGMPDDVSRGSGNLSNEKNWKILRDKSTGALIEPEHYNPSNPYDYSYTYDPRKHILDLEESESDPSKRKSFLGKVAGYIEVLKAQNYPYSYRE